MVDTKMVKTVGEHLVCAGLARRGWAPALTRDGIARTDVLAVATHLAERPTIEVQVKTASEHGKLTSWLINGKAQELGRSDREWFVFVLVPAPPGQPRHFVVPRDHVVAATWAVHNHWRHDPAAAPGKRNTPIGQSRLNWTVWADYEERWDLLDASTDKTPVLLAEFVRDYIRLDHIGLPPSHPWQFEPPAWLHT